MAIAGAGIVGLARGRDVRRGLSAVVVERDDRARGASVRNFGHGFVSAQAGDALVAALEARERWIELAREAGFWLLECGSIVVARAPEELAVLEEYAAARVGQARVVTDDELLAHAPIARDGVLGGLFAPIDCRVEPREALPALARWLAEEKGVRFHWGATVVDVEPASCARVAATSSPTR